MDYLKHSITHISLFIVLARLPIGPHFWTEDCQLHLEPQMIGWMRRKFWPMVWKRGCVWKTAVMTYGDGEKTVWGSPRYSGLEQITQRTGTKSWKTFSGSVMCEMKAWSIHCNTFLYYRQEGFCSGFFFQATFKSCFHSSTIKTEKKPNTKSFKSSLL